MVIIENKLFPTKQVCKHCESTILIENENECEYRPEREWHLFHLKDLKECHLKECYIWKCPCCHSSNYIYLK